MRVYAGCVRVRVLVCVCGVREREGGRGKKGERVLYNPEREKAHAVLSGVWGARRLWWEAGFTHTHAPRSTAHWR